MESTENLNNRITILDFPDICRFCLKFGRDDLGGLKLNIKSIYESITHLTVKENDMLPQNVCDECVNKLEDLADFIDRCKFNYDYLTAIVISEQDKQLLQDLIKQESENENSFISLPTGPEEHSDDEYVCVVDEDDVSIKTEEYVDHFPEEIDGQIVHRIIKKEPKETNTKSKTYTCLKCGKRYRNLKLLKLHLRTHLGLKPYKCPICNKRFNQRISLKQHNNNFHLPKTFKCSICDWTGADKELLENHEMKHSENYIPKKIIREKKWRCLECSKSFGKKNDLQRHLRTHTGIRPFVCSLCNKSFTQKSTLNRHKAAIHVTDTDQKKKFQCYICERKFHRKDNLEMHIVNCHINKINEYSFQNPDTKLCEICGKKFSTYSYLKQHIKAHNKTEPKRRRKKGPDELITYKYPTTSNLCSVCGRSFEKRSAYQAHMRRSHGPPIPKKSKESGELKNKRVYQCWECGIIKSTHCNLKVHMRIHTGEKPYECKFCFRKFTAWNSWNEHENIHTGMKPYQCSICKKGFRQRSSLRKHSRSNIHSKLPKA